MQKILENYPEFAAMDFDFVCEMIQKFTLTKEIQIKQKSLVF
jgi:hypothetical protein